MIKCYDKHSVATTSNKEELYTTALNIGNIPGWCPSSRVTAPEAEQTIVPALVVPRQEEVPAGVESGDRDDATHPPRT